MLPFTAPVCPILVDEDVARYKTGIKIQGTGSSSSLKVAVDVPVSTSREVVAVEAGQSLIPRSVGVEVAPAIDSGVGATPSLSGREVSPLLLTAKPSHGGNMAGPSLPVARGYIFRPDWSIREDSSFEDLNVISEFFQKGRTPPDDFYWRERGTEQVLDDMLYYSAQAAMSAGELHSRKGVLGEIRARYEREKKEVEKRLWAELALKKKAEDESEANKTYGDNWHRKAQEEEAKNQVLQERVAALEKSLEEAKAQASAASGELVRAQVDSDSSLQLFLDSESRERQAVWQAEIAAVDRFKNSADGRAWLAENMADTMQRLLDATKGYVNQRVPDMDWGGLQDAFDRADEEMSKDDPSAGP